MGVIKKIIFLDIDGVCNSYIWDIQDRSNTTDEDLDPCPIELLNVICHNTGAKIVISSDWRIDEYYKRRLERAGLKNIIRRTPITVFDGHHFSRGEEIQMWLEWHPEVTKYVIIDDTPDFMIEQQSHFVKIDPYKGLTEEDCKKIFKILE